MYFEEEEGFHPDLFHVVRREIYALNSNLEGGPYGLKYVPTHTEDGIPIRKLYVSNLPPKTTRSELFGVFAQYGFIKSCWLRMGDKGPNRTPTPTYAFVTYSNPADAHKALQAPLFEKTLRGRNLKISPADSWHQPTDDADGHSRCKPRNGRHHDENATPVEITTSQEDVAAAVEPEPIYREHNDSEPTTSTREVPQQETSESSKENEPQDESCYTMLDILNQDCLTHIMDYVPIRDLIRSERVSKPWQNMIREYLQGIRTFKTSWWQHVPLLLTTAVLRRVLQRVGPSLTRLHIDHHWSALNDRTAHTVGKFCPNLEELKIIGMHTRNWNPLTYGCKNLKSLSFVSCSKLTDSSLVHLVRNDSCIESLTVANNTHVTGLFLTGSNPQKLTSLSFYNCYSLQGTVLSTAMDSLPGLTTLKLDVCPHTMWKIIPLILTKLPKLVELSLSEYTSADMCFSTQNSDAFCDAIGNLTELKTLNVSRNIYITNAVLKRIAQTCTKLECLNISSCNSRRIFPHPGVGDEGVAAVCRGCRALRWLDASYVGALSDAGLRAAAALPRLHRLLARGNPALSAEPLAACLAACHQLQEVDVCGCDAVTEEVICAAVRALEDNPRLLTLRLAGTAVEILPECPTHKLLTVDVHDDRSNPQLRLDFVDRIFEDSSDDSFGDVYDHDDFDDFFGPEDGIYMGDDDLIDFDDLHHVQFGLHAPDIILI